MLNKVLFLCVAFVGLLALHLVLPNSRSSSSNSSVSNGNGPSMKITPIGDNRFLGTLEDGRQCTVMIENFPEGQMNLALVRSNLDYCYKSGRFKFPPSTTPSADTPIETSPANKISNYYRNRIDANPNSNELVQILIFLEDQPGEIIERIPLGNSPEDDAKYDRIINDWKQRRKIYYQQVQGELIDSGCHIEIFPNDQLMLIIPEFRATVPLKEIPLVAQHPSVAFIDQEYAMQTENTQQQPARLNL